MEDEVINGGRVRERREAMGLSRPKCVRKIAELGGGKVSPQALAQLEEGSTEKPKYAMYLAKAVNTSWEYLIGRTDNPTPANGGMVNDLARFGASNDSNRSQNETGQEGTQVLMEISRMLGAVEGSLKTTFNTRFDAIDRKLDDHDRRLEALEERTASGPTSGRRR